MNQKSGDEVLGALKEMKGKRLLVPIVSYRIFPVLLESGERCYQELSNPFKNGIF
jgi:hypothetical protein